MGQSLLGKKHVVRQQTRQGEKSNTDEEQTKRTKTKGLPERHDASRHREKEKGKKKGIE